MSQKWLLILVVAVLTALAGLGAWWIDVYTTADSTRLWDLTIAGFGGLLGLATRPADTPNGKVP